MPEPPRCGPLVRGREQGSVRRAPAPRALPGSAPSPTPFLLVLFSIFSSSSEQRSSGLKLTLWLVMTLSLRASSLVLGLQAQATVSGYCGTEA